MYNDPTNIDNTAYIEADSFLNKDDNFLTIDNTSSLNVIKDRKY
jgi:hypothetical protein